LNVEVRLFAAARQLAGREKVILTLDAPETVAQLRLALASQIPALADLAPRIVFALNAEYAREDQPVSADAEIAAIPPVSGG
jgi:molybdopterin converting factor subunit 1